MLARALLLSLAVLAGCAAQPNLRITSTPSDAEVYLRTPATGRRQQLGRTPVEARFERTGTFELQVIKPGFQPYSEQVLLEGQPLERDVVLEPE